MNAISRRKFLKITGYTIGAAAAASSLTPVIKGAKKINKEKVNGIQTIPTYCDLCFWKCSANCISGYFQEFSS